jgi:hypothetical protein
MRTCEQQAVSDVHSSPAACLYEMNSSVERVGGSSLFINTTGGTIRNQTWQPCVHGGAVSDTPKSFALGKRACCFTPAKK